MELKDVAFYGLIGLLVLYMFGSPTIQGVVDQSIGRVISGGAYVGRKAYRVGTTVSSVVRSVANRLRR